MSCCSPLQSRQVDNSGVRLFGCRLANADETGKSEIPEGTTALAEFTLENTNGFAVDITVEATWKSITWSADWVLFENETFETNMLLDPYAKTDNPPLDDPGGVSVDITRVESLFS